jgi:hypothetical protein
MIDFNQDTRLSEAQEWLRGEVDRGAKCPCCTQYARVYRRKITASQAAALIRFWRTYGTAWGHLATVDKSREASKLSYWKLIEQESQRREDGGRSGWWRITVEGLRFIRNQETVPKYIRIYNDRLLGVDAVQRVSISDVLGTRFDYDELMGGQ